MAGTASPCSTSGGFPTVGGHKVFRDEIWGSMRAVFRADHAYNKKHGLYDFPQAGYSRRARTTLLSLPPVRKKAEQQMKQHLIQPFARVLAESPILKQRKKRDNLRPCHKGGSQVCKNIFVLHNG